VLKCAENLSSDQKQFVEIGANLLWLFFIANRRLAGAQHYLLDITHNAMMGALALTLFMFLIWEPVPKSLNVKMALLVTLAVVGQGFMI
jgi:ABC-type sulfate transport system permease subunit